MASRALFTVAVAAALITACDLTQKPQTGSSSAAAIKAVPAVGASPQAPTRALPAPADTAGVLTDESATGQRSIRLFGPGISRKRQTRV